MESILAGFSDEDVLDEGIPVQPHQSLSVSPLQDVDVVMEDASRSLDGDSLDGSIGIQSCKKRDWTGENKGIGYYI
jgi:hypothetical protein